MNLKKIEEKFCDRSTSIIDKNSGIPNDHGDKLILDCRALSIESVQLVSNTKTETCSFEVDFIKETLTIDLNSVCEDQSISMIIFYSTTENTTALQWLDKEQTADRQYPYMFSQCQAIHARSLYPCQDTPGVKSTYKAKVTCDKPLTVVSANYFRCFHESNDFS